jgi:hypothetical protein
VVSKPLEKEAFMEECSIVRIDFATNVFQVHGSDSAGKRLFSKKVSRGQLDTRINRPSESLPPFGNAFDPCLFPVDSEMVTLKTDGMRSLRG